MGENVEVDLGDFVTRTVARLQRVIADECAAVNIDPLGSEVGVVLSYLRAATDYARSSRARDFLARLKQSREDETRAAIEKAATSKPNSSDPNVGVSVYS